MHRRRKTAGPRRGLISPELPQEVLLTIFRFTEPPSHLYLPDIRSGPRNPWLISLRAKTALVLVCKAWAAPATECLYSDIVLRRMGQISALAHTFRAAGNQSFSNLVRSLHIDMCVVLTHCADVIRQDFQYILSQSTMLLAFTFNPHPHPPFDYHSGPPPGQLLSEPTAFNPTWILDFGHERAGSLLARLLNSRLLTLSLGLSTDEGSFRPLPQILSSAPHLTSLDLGQIFPGSNNVLPDPWSTLPDLFFPELKSLSIYCDSLPFVQYVNTQWTMPRLAYLYCKDDIPMTDLPPHYSDWALPYLSANTLLLPRLYDLCPRISHLVIHLSVEERTALNLNSPTLRYLDLIHKPSVAAYRAIALAPRATAHAPQLTKVRMVTTPCDFFPLHFHPSHMPGSDHALEDLSDIPGAHDSDERANWLMLTTGGIEVWCSEGRVRQHAWAVVLDELCDGTLHPGAAGDPRIPDDDETDSEGMYEYASLPVSPVELDSDDSDGDGTESGLGDDDGEMEDARSAEDGLDSDMEREWFEVEPETPPYPNKVAFVDDPLDSSRGQYDRETILERFSQSQLGDFLLE
ncbi:hypothetical protein LXA43DRAFT_1077489 [Ganoderma leucocontextum]|nr:hypothetical protein LXA43DRAFT_1077489 [Ganoderma leucocontextum]